MARLSEENKKLDKKSKDNKRAAYLLSEEKIYHAAVSRLYYSAYQKMLCYQQEYIGHEKPQSGESSHVKLIESIDNTIKKYMMDENMRIEATKCLQFKRKIHNLKDARVESDYKSIEDYSKEDYESYHELFKSISSLLGQYRNLVERG